MIDKVHLYGAGGHAKVIIDILRAEGAEIRSIVDVDESKRSLSGIEVVHSASGLSPVIVSIGNNAVRKRVAEELDCEFATAVHPTAVVSPSARIGEGSVVMHGAIVQADAEVGRHCIINTGASVDHECRIGDYSHISPHATLCGNVTVGCGAHIGAGSVVIPGIKIGDWAVIGAGAVIVRDVAPGSVVVGNPGREIKRIAY